MVLINKFSHHSLLKLRRLPKTLCRGCLLTVGQVRSTDPGDLFCHKTVQLLDDFMVSGPHGIHVCMVFEVTTLHFYSSL